MGHAGSTYHACTPAPRTPSAPCSREPRRCRRAIAPLQRPAQLHPHASCRRCPQRRAQRPPDTRHRARRASPPPTPPTATNDGSTRDAPVGSHADVAPAQTCQRQDTRPAVLATTTHALAADLSLGTRAADPRAPADDLPPSHRGCNFLTPSLPPLDARNANTDRSRRRGRSPAPRPIPPHDGDPRDSDANLHPPTHTTYDLTAID